MSLWSHVRGTITVNPMGESQAEKRYVLDTVLAHLPKVSGSEEDMQVYVIQKNGTCSSSSCDEFGNYSNLGNSLWVYGKHRSFDIQDEYIIIVNGDLRDRDFNDALKSLNKWLNRLSKRVVVRHILVEISGNSGYTKMRSKVIRESYGGHWNMFETPSWGRTSKPGEKNWCEKFMRESK